MTNSNTPALRFGGFEGVWTHTRLADIAQMYQPQTIASKELQQSGVPVFGANGFIGFYNAANHATDQVTISARGEKTGTPSYVSGPVWITGNSMVVNVDSSGIDKRFLYGNLSSRSLKSLVTGGAQPQLTRNVLNEYRISIPPTLEEQRAIGELLADLDALIEQHRAKLANLQQTKTALMQRMFPQDGADEPELRLGGSSNPWVLRHLGEFEITTGPFGSTLHAEDYVEHGTPIVTTEHFKSGLLPLTGQGVPQVSDDDRRRLKAYWLRTDDIVFSRVGSVDINARVTELQNGWLFSGRVLRVRPDATCESEFLHSVLETNPVRGSIRKRAVGMSMPSINTAILANTSFYQPPTLEEQRAIGEVFSNLDDLIAAEASYIAQLTQAKTALLQRMFV